MDEAIEVNFDGLVGLSHTYGGLPTGNMASEQNAESLAYPKQAALQGLKKMQLLMELGLCQAVLPPQSRPAISVLKNLGFSGTTAQILQQAYLKAPSILAACFSASSMWAANAATVSPSADTADSKVHLTVANLISHLHRAIEPPTTYSILKRIFNDSQYFEIHPPIAANSQLGDEGAANHNRLCADYGKPGLEIFVYGKAGFGQSLGPKIYPARQTLEASLTVARLHKLNANKMLVLQQNPDCIDAGVFHNDVISVANQNVFFYHQDAFLAPDAISKIQQSYADTLYLLPVTSRELSIKAAVESYLFNSQLVTTQAGHMVLIAPYEAKRSAAVQKVLARILAEDNPIKEVYYVDCRESMKNGGGPACLRLRVVLTQQELAIAQKSSHVFLTPARLLQLQAWIEKHYRETLKLADLCDPLLLEENQRSLDELTQILNLGSIYDFQHE